MFKFIKTKKFIFGAIALLLIGGYFFNQQRKSVNGEELPVYEAKTDKLVTLESRDITENITLAGKIDAESKAEVRFQTSGRLAWVGVKVGDTVKKWQSLASLDKTELRKSLEKQLNDYKSQLDTFQDTQDEYETIKENNNLTDEMQRILNRSQYGLNNAVIAYELADLTVKYATIWSPINGVVVGIDQPNPGVNITPASASFYVIDPQSLYFKSEIDEEDVNRIYVGQKTKIQIDTFPDLDIDSEISYISFAPISGQSSTVYEVRFKLDLDNQDLRYRLGMNGDAEILISRIDSALSLPLEAVNQDGDGTYYVYVNTPDNKTEKRVVEIGIESDDYIQITSGLSQDEKVIIKQ